MINYFSVINAVIEQAGFDLYDLTNMHRTDDHRLRWFDAVYLNRKHAQLISSQMWAKEHNESIREMQDQRRKAILSNIDLVLSQLAANRPE
jgi:predicted metallo-beta-lactamase superfamily hydrolase